MTTMASQITSLMVVYSTVYSDADQRKHQSSASLAFVSWWRHQMETFSALLALCAGNSPVSGEFPTQRPVTPSFDVFFDLHLIKRLSKHSRGWWFETLSCPLWRHCNVGNSPEPVNSPHKGPVTLKMFPFDDVIMCSLSSNGHLTGNMITYPCWDWS